MKRFALALAAGIALSAPPSPANASVSAKISLSQQRMEVHVDGQLVHTWPVSTGRSGYETPAGTFTPYWLSRDHRSSKYDDAPMPWAVFFRGDYAVHGTMATGMLGRRASHGCVRLAPGNARRFFELVQAHGLSNSKITLHDAPPPRSERPAIAEIGAKPGRSRVLHAARVTPASPPVVNYGRYASTPMFIYTIGPQGQMVPVHYMPAYRPR